MDQIRPLPEFLEKKYQDWKATSYTENQSLFQTLADEGQEPHGMIISCCDSRVDPSAMFKAKAGELFVLRTVANLVPPYDPEGEAHAPSAAIQYAVTALKIPHIYVVGHSKCGGVAGCHAMCSGKAPELEEKANFVGRWVSFLAPAYQRIDTSLPEEDQLRALEQQAVVLSLENLMTYPFVAEACNAGALTLHGLWTDIRAGEFHQYLPESNSFVAV